MGILITALSRRCARPRYVDLATPCLRRAVPGPATCTAAPGGCLRGSVSRGNNSLCPAISVLPGSGVRNDAALPDRDQPGSGQRCQSEFGCLSEADPDLCPPLGADAAPVIGRVNEIVGVVATHLWLQSSLLTSLIFSLLFSSDFSSLLTSLLFWSFP